MEVVVIDDIKRFLSETQISKPQLAHHINQLRGLGIAVIVTGHQKAAPDATWKIKTKCATSDSGVWQFSERFTRNYNSISTKISPGHSYPLAGYFGDRD